MNMICDRHQEILDKLFGDNDTPSQQPTVDLNQQVVIDTNIEKRLAKPKFDLKIWVKDYFLSRALSKYGYGCDYLNFKIDFTEQTLKNLSNPDIKAALQEKIRQTLADTTFQSNYKANHNYSQYRDIDKNDPIFSVFAKRIIEQFEHLMDQHASKLYELGYVRQNINGSIDDEDDENSKIELLLIDKHRSYNTKELQRMYAELNIYSSDHLFKFKDVVEDIEINNIALIDIDFMYFINNVLKMGDGVDYGFAKNIEHINDFEDDTIAVIADCKPTLFADIILKYSALLDYRDEERFWKNKAAEKMLAEGIFDDYLKSKDVGVVNVDIVHIDDPHGDEPLPDSYQIGMPDLTLFEGHTPVYRNNDRFQPFDKIQYDFFYENNDYIVVFGKPYTNFDDKEKSKQVNLFITNNTAENREKLLKHKSKQHLDNIDNLYGGTISPLDYDWCLCDYCGTDNFVSVRSPNFVCCSCGLKN